MWTFLALRAEQQRSAGECCRQTFLPNVTGHCGIMPLNNPVNCRQLQVPAPRELVDRLGKLMIYDPD
jgi:hypothetical protein